MSHKSRAQPDADRVVHALAPRDLSLADALSKYRLLGALGQGGMADVYLAVADGPEGFRKLCVLKLLKESMAQDEEYRAMFLDEARLAARLNHPNIVQTFEVGEVHGRLMIAMEYIEGQPATRVRRRLTPQQFPLSADVSMLCDVLDALEYAHALSDFDGSKLGIVHRDVSPHNIIIGYDARVKLVDFGIAKSSASLQETQAGVLKGKVGYMAPEQASMLAVDARADVFSVGVILWEAIAGMRVAAGMSAHETLARRMEGADPKILDVVPDVDLELARICDRAMARFPGDRHSSAAELQGELEAWLRKRAEVNRKDLAASLREAFTAERDHMSALVEQRLADNSASGLRSLPERAAAPAVSQVALPTAAPSLAAPGTLPPIVATKPTELKLVQGPRALVVLGSAAVVALGLVAATYVATAASWRAASLAAPSAAQAPSDVGDLDLARGPEVTPTVTFVAPATPSAVAPRPTRPPSLGQTTKSALPAAHSVIPGSSASALSAPSAPPGLSKNGLRTLDEKDPYAQ